LQTSSTFLEQKPSSASENGNAFGRSVTLAKYMNAKEMILNRDLWRQYLRIQAWYDRRQGVRSVAKVPVLCHQIC
jgi:hypothetical protein